MKQLMDVLLPLYAEGEARAMARIALEDAFAVSTTDIYADKVRQFSVEDERLWSNILQRLAEGWPVQYAVGRARFCDMLFEVDPSTLIPRPETEQLVTIASACVDRLVQTGRPASSLRILDAGTGSGCIAISLKRQWKETAVEAWDIDEATLSVARRNAVRLDASVEFKRCDILSYKPAGEPFDVIVSNPPYVLYRERSNMEANVLDYEPERALFVPDDDPLLFYRALARLSSDGLLRQGGFLAVETNREFAGEVCKLFSSFGIDSAVEKDFVGNERFVWGEKK